MIALLAAQQVSASKHGGRGESDIIDLAIVGVVLVLAVVSWYVTTWRIDGDALQVATGLIRRNTVRVPLARVQAVDLVEPLVARILGLAEVRVRTAGGSGGDARLQYLKLEEAHVVRGSLLALAHGLPDSTPPPPERFLYRVSNGRLVASMALRGAAFASVLPVLVVISLLAAGVVSATVIGVAGGTLLLDLFALVSRMVRRVAEEWGFEVAEAPDGLRIRGGFASRVAETIPYGRVQAIRMEEPLLWRPFGWCRLELHIAGSVRHGHDQPRSAIRRALVPVGTPEEAQWLLGRILPEHRVATRPPPRRARVRAPLSYHFLSAGRNASCAVSTSGRVRRLTEWVPLGKVQSIRSVQGPFERLLRLASVHLDAAGRRTSVRYWHRSAPEMEELMGALPGECEAARGREASRRQAPPPVAPSPVVPGLPPPGLPPLTSSPSAGPMPGSATPDRGLSPPPRPGPYPAEPGAASRVPPSSRASPPVPPSISKSPRSLSWRLLNT